MNFGSGVAYAYSGGFGGSFNAYKHEIDTLERRLGKPVHFVESTRYPSKDYEDEPTNPGVPDVCYDQAVHLARELRKKDIKSVCLFDHSLGGTTGMAFTMAYSDEFNVVAVVLLNPVCVLTPGVIRIVGRISTMFIFDDMSTAEGRSYWKSSLSYFMNPIRCLREAMVAGRVRLFDLFITWLRNNDAETLVFLGASPRDRVVPREGAFTVARVIDPDGKWVTLMDLPGRHDSQNEPQWVIFALEKAGFFAPERETR